MMWRATSNPQPKPKPAVATETIAREEAIQTLRAEFLKLVDDENSICKVAAERGIFCKGFQRYSDFEIRKRYRWIARKDRRYTREEIEDLANRWQIARQDVDDSCRGWDDFSNEELAKAVGQMTGRNVSVA
jgi:hypothetical protein